jgi:hypothetical protein
MTRAFDANPKDRNRKLKTAKSFSETGNLPGSRNGACLSTIVTLGVDKSPAHESSRFDRAGLLRPSDCGARQGTLATRI